ncbi:MAG: hypothetical protein V3V74_07850, partial [Nitrosomonadaceae bacterium]
IEINELIALLLKSDTAQFGPLDTDYTFETFNSYLSMTGDLTNERGYISGFKDLTLGQTGDFYGNTFLTLRNRSGENGAVFEITGSVNLVDFVFKHPGGQRNIRFEGRSEITYFGIAQEWQIGQPNISAGNLLAHTVMAEKGLVQYGTTPYLYLHNDSHEDIDGGRQGRVIFKGEQSGGEATSLFQFEASHDGAGDDQLGKGIWSVNTGAGLVEAMRIDSNLLATFKANIAVKGSTFIDGELWVAGDKIAGSVWIRGDSTTELNVKTFFTSRVQQAGANKFEVSVKGEYSGGGDLNYVIEIDEVTNPEVHTGIGNRLARVATMTDCDHASGPQTITVSGDQSVAFSDNDTFAISGSASNDNTGYKIDDAGITYDAANEITTFNLDAGGTALVASSETGTVTIDAYNNTFKWSDDGGGTWDETGVETQSGYPWYALNNDIEINFLSNATDILVVGDQWTFTAEANPTVPLNVDTTNNETTIGGSAVLGLNSAVFQPAAGGDSTTFFQVLDADGGTPILNINTTDGSVSLGKATPPSHGAMLDIAGDLQVSGNDIQDSSGNTVISFNGNGAINYLPMFTFDLRMDWNKVISFGRNQEFGVGQEDTNNTFQFIRGHTVNQNVLMVLDSNGNFGLNETTPETLLELTHATPTITGHCSTHSDALDARAVTYQAFGEQSSGEETTLGKWTFAHDSAADDEKAYWKLFINTGADGDSPTEALEIGSDLLATFAGALKITGSIGFYNTTPVAQEAHIVDADGTLADITTKFNALLLSLETYGLLAAA